MTSMLYPTTNPSAAEQMVVARGEGPYIYDRSGKRYLEGMAGLWCTSLGYGNEEIIEVATQQMRELSFSHMFGGKTHDSAMMLADKLAAMVPMKNARVFLGNSGSDANDTLVKMIRYHATATGQPQRTKIIARDKGYHGVTVASASLTGIPTNHNHFSYRSMPWALSERDLLTFTVQPIPVKAKQNSSRVEQVSSRSKSLLPVLRRLLQ